MRSLCATDDADGLPSRCAKSIEAVPKTIVGSFSQQNPNPTGKAAIIQTMHRDPRVENHHFPMKHSPILESQVAETEPRDRMAQVTSKLIAGAAKEECSHTKVARRGERVRNWMTVTSPGPVYDSPSRFSKSQFSISGFGKLTL